MNNINAELSEFYIVVGNNIYVSSQRNVDIENGVSFKNISTGKYLRHYGGRIIESNFSDTDIFKYDSTFILHSIGKYITLSCSNSRFVNMYICFDIKKGMFTISLPSDDVVLFKFRKYFDINSIDLLDNFNENTIGKVKNNVIINDTVDEKNIEMAKYYSFQSINRVKELAARQKILNNKKLVVFFVISYQAKFGMETVYNEMLNSDIFDPYIYVISAKDSLFNSSPQYFNDCIDSYEFFKNSGYKTILGYDQETQEPLYIEEFNPDIVIYNNPNISTQAYFKNMLMNHNFLACYIPYAMNVVNHFGYHYEHRHINYAWKQFCPTSFDYKVNITKSKYGGLNAVNLGYPKLDVYSENINYDNIPSKILNGKKNVIIAPHWSYKLSDNLATFHLYNKLFVELLDTYKNINFIFKPHPDLMYRILSNKTDKNLMTYDEYMHYIEYFDKSENGIYFEHGNYIDLFKISSCLITDCGSFIAEYLPSKHPCIYLVNPDKKNFFEGFNEYGKSILNSYYLAYNAQDIKSHFSDIILKENDYKKELRYDIIKKEFKDIGSSGKNIVRYLKNILTSTFNFDGLQ